MLTVDIEIDAEAWGADAAQWVEALTQAVRESVQFSPWGAAVAGPTPLEVSLQLVSDAVSHDLNQTYRGQDKPTNVLSFPQLERDQAQTLPVLLPPEILLGDIVIASGVAKAEAALQAKSVRNHVVHLVTHGALHLMGYDHIEDEEAEVMEQAERLILARLGITDPYAEVC